MTLNGVNMYYSGTKPLPEWQMAIFLAVVFLPAFLAMVARDRFSSNQGTGK
jgi:hypothetical protein